MKRTCLMKETQPLEGTQHLICKDINRRLPSLYQLRELYPERQTPFTVAIKNRVSKFCL